MSEGTGDKWGSNPRISSDEKTTCFPSQHRKAHVQHPHLYCSCLQPFCFLQKLQESNKCIDYNLKRTCTGRRERGKEKMMWQVPLAAV